MKLKILTMCVALLMLAGCGGAPAPKTTFTDSAPDMVMAKTDKTQVTYEGYRLYLDVLEKFAELTAQENLAFVEMVTLDLTAAGKEPDMAGFNAQIDPMISQMMADPLMEPIITKVLAATGMTREQYLQAAKMDYLPQDLYDQMMSHLLETKGADEDIAAVAEAYQGKFTERTDFTNEKILVKIDGKDVPLTEAHTQYIKYTGAMARAAAIDDIATKHLTLEDAKTRGLEVAEADFAAYQEEMIAHLKGDEIYNLLLPKALELLNITEEAYYKEIEPYFWLNYAGEGFGDLMQKEYEKLPQEGKPATVEEYLNGYFDGLLAGYEIVNLMGR